VRIAFQGVRGAYSEAAVRKHYPKAEPVGFALSEQVFEAVHAGKADLGLLPVENTIAGNVAVNTDLFLKEKVFAVRECYLLIEHCLLAPAPARLDDIKTVYSHPVALAQCRTFTDSRKMKAVPEYDTAGAAELVSQRRVLGEAAIASELCAKAYGLKVLKRNIQDHRENITRFLAFTREDRVPKGLKMGKTSVAFSTGHKPGALLACLQRLADRKINLTRLESRPIPENPFEYSFFVDLVGGMKDARIVDALKALRREARHVKVLGSYPLAAKP
jgi:prephenate dehydratase